MAQARLNLAARMLIRDWRAGETMVLLVALVVAVAAMSAVGFFTDRVRQAVTQQAGEALAADLRLESDYPLAPELAALAAARGLSTAEVVNFRAASPRAIPCAARSASPTPWPASLGLPRACPGAARCGQSRACLCVSAPTSATSSGSGS
jgi:hypothetical protein